MKFWVRKNRDGWLEPADAASEEIWAKLPIGVDLRADIVKPRNPGLHRKAFALLSVVWPHTNYPNIEILRATMTIGAGYVDPVIDPMTGRTSLVPKSWSFDNMDDLEFKEMYNRLVDVALKIVPNSRRADWEEAVDQIVRF